MTQAQAYDTQDIPPYESLPMFAGTGERQAWDVFGLGDQLDVLFAVEIAEHRFGAAVRTEA